MLCYAGIGAWHIPVASAIDKINAIRKIGAPGFVLFSYGGMTNDGSSNDYLTKVSKSSFIIPADPPQLQGVGPREKDGALLPGI